MAKLWKKSVDLDRVVEAYTVGRDHVLDRALVEDVGDGRPGSMLRGVLSLLRELDIAVLAEGIERRGQLEWLRDHGCQRAQGFLLGRPAPPGTKPPATVEDALGEAPETRG